MIDRYFELARAPGHRAILFTIGQDGAPTAALTSIVTPTLILWGEEDALIPVSDARRFADVIPNMDLVTFPNVGHIPMEEAPDESAAATAQFLERIHTPAPSTIPAN